MGIRLSDQRYEEIKREVIRMFTEYDVFCVPINGFEIAHKMGVGVYPYTAYPHEKRQKLMQLSEDGFSARMGEVNRASSIMMKGAMDASTIR